MEYDFSTLHVHKHQIKLLKKLRRKGPQIPVEANISSLFDDNLIQPTKRCREQNIKEIRISDKGKLYLQWRREDMFRHRWPVYLSIAAILISLAAFIKSFFI